MLESVEVIDKTQKQVMYSPPLIREGPITAPAEILEKV